MLFFRPLGLSPSDHLSPNAWLRTCYIWGPRQDNKTDRYYSWGNDNFKGDSSNHNAVWEGLAENDENNLCGEKWPLQGGSDFQAAHKKWVDIRGRGGSGVLVWVGVEKAEEAEQNANTKANKCERAGPFRKGPVCLMYWVCWDGMGEGKRHFWKGWRCQTMKGSQYL